MKVEHIHINELMDRSGVGFGTSGARGRVEDMSASVCYAYTRGFLQHLEASAGLIPGADVAIAGDLRPSTPAIMSALTAACADAGYRPLNCGFIPSPAVACFGIDQGVPSIMVTGSHIPADRNGIKFNTAVGEILKDDEVGIRAQSVTIPAEICSDLLPQVDPRAQATYVRRYLDFFPADSLAGMRVAVYQHSGVARDLLGEILEGLGADVLRLGRSEVFVPVDTEAIRPEDVSLAREWVNDHAFDAVVSTDGDADRPLIGTERGEWLRGDVVGVLCAHALGISAVATPVSSNTVAERSGWFGQVERTRIGSPYVIAGMQKLLAGGAKSVGGYEANGGFLLATDLKRNGRRLTALPTRDAVLPILALLVSAREQGLPLSGLAAVLPARFTASDRLKDFPTEHSSRLIESLSMGGPPSMEAMFGGVCGKITAIDRTDGLRMTFDSAEIVHLRPSGNAPEFRCYNEAASADRAEALNRACLAILAEARQTRR